MGPSSTCAPLARVSSASAAPTRSTSSTSHVAPRAAPHGKHTDGGPPANRWPRAPLGPSVTRSAGTSPDAGTFHQSDPRQRPDQLLVVHQAPGFQIIR